jgi:hypothetical protein
VFYAKGADTTRLTVDFGNRFEKCFCPSFFEDLFLIRFRYVLCVIQDLWTNYDLKQIKKVKVSRKRPGVAQRVPGSLGSQIFMTFGT